MLDLCDSQLEVVPLVPRDHTELLQGALERRAGTFAYPDRVAPPPIRQLVDPGACVFLAHPAALRQRLRQLVGSFGRQCDRAEERER
jgi:hypothetical protein